MALVQQQWRLPPQVSRLASALWLACVMTLEAKTLQFCGYPWVVRSGQGGPGPNTWEENNVWLDGSTNLHLKISVREGKWSCAEITMNQRLGFGGYRFRIVGRLDGLDENVVLGLFNYPTRDVGPDATHEIDIEFARWGKAGNPPGSFTVWPVDKTMRQVTHAFSFIQTSTRSTHLFEWSRKQVRFHSLDEHRESHEATLARWLFAPQEPERQLSGKPMPVHINLWLFQGQPPANSQEVEIVVADFQFTPE